MKFLSLILLIGIVSYFINSYQNYVKKEKNKKFKKNIKERKKELYEKYNQKEEIEKISEFEKQWSQEAKKERIEKNKSNIQKGKEYEFFIGRYFKEQGYKIYYQGINQGFQDYGIDLIAYKGQEILLIQCKNWAKWKINRNVLDKFNEDCKKYIQYHQRQTKNKEIKKLFIVSNSNLTKDAINMLFNPENNINFLHIPNKK